MKICHVTCAHTRYDVRILKKECKSLTDSGFEVVLVVCDEIENEDFDGVKIVSTGYQAQHRIDRFTKAVELTIRKALEIGADVYHLHDPELLRKAHLLVKTKKKVIFDAHEDTEMQIMDKEWIPQIIRKQISALFGFYAKKVMSRMDGLVTVTPKIVEKLKQYNDNVVMVTNYPIIGELQNSGEQEDKGQYVFFAGGVDPQWCHENIAKAIDKIEGVSYYFAGRGNEEYVESIGENSKEKVKYLGLIPHDEVINYYKESLAGMALLKAFQVGKEGTLGNTKLFEVMEAGRPVICSDFRLWKEIIEEYNCGICVDCDDVDSISNTISYIMNHPDEASEMGNNGRRAILERYNWETQAKILVDFYNRVIEKR